MLEDDPVLLAYISIHAPREGCDVVMFVSIILVFDFNPRTPRGVRLSKYW